MPQMDKLKATSVPDTGKPHNKSTIRPDMRTHVPIPVLCGQKQCNIVPGAILFFLLLTLLVGCSTQTMRSASAEQSVYQASTSNGIPEYQLGFGDVIEVKFFRNTQFNETVTVRPDGRISLQRVGDILVNGLTPTKLDSIITTAYAEFVREPDVTVFVREFGDYQVYVLGEVNHPGSYPVQRNMTVLQALASAGGHNTATAQLGSVMVLRRDYHGDISAFQVDLGKPLKTKSKQAIVLNNVPVLPQDIIYVPKKFLASSTEFLAMVWAGLLPPVDMYLRALLWSRY